MDIRIINQEEMSERMGRSKATLWKWVKDGKFPKPLYMGKRTLGWTESQIYEWLKEVATTK